MNRADLVNAVAKGLRIPKNAASDAVNIIIVNISDALMAGEEVRIPRFGTFKVKHRAARLGRNPATGATIKTPAKRVPAFTFAKNVRDLVDESSDE